MKSRVPIIVVLIVALIATGFTRQLAATKRNANRQLGEQSSSSAAQLSRMNSFALALLLGGLRGPLVMVLWSSSETQKSDKNLEDFDTKVEWIRLLQPEFDSVHIFQIWNKAYNISAQMASLANKYHTIIDAIDYARNVDAERPNNINIIYAIGGVYGDKLGDSSEKIYYRRRVREESLPHVVRQKLAASDPGYRRLQLDSVLDEHGNILESYLKPTSALLTDPDYPKDTYDGSELPFLKQFQPFPYGVDPNGFGYNYRKRAQLLQRLGTQKHAQLADLVIDSRPAVDLKMWGESEWDHGRRAELRALGRAIPSDRPAMEAASENIQSGIKFDDAAKAQLREAIFSYDLATRVWTEGDVEYLRHMQRFKANIALYESHRDEIAADIELVKGDRNYLKLLLAEPAEKVALAASARQAYQRAMVRFGLVILHYYVDPTIASHTFPPGVTKANFAATLGAAPDKLTPPQVLAIVSASVKEMQEPGKTVPDDITEYLNYIRRADARIKQLPQP